MIIKTTLSEIDETIFKYGDLLGWADGVQVHDEDTHLGVSNYRVQIPSLNISLREGCLMHQEGGDYSMSYNSETGKYEEIIIPPPPDAPWEYEASVTIVCELDEKDPKKYLGWTTGGLQAAAYDYLYPKFSYSGVGEVECFIDTSDFMPDEAKAQYYAKYCEDQYEAEEGELE